MKSAFASIRVFALEDAPSAARAWRSRVRTAIWCLVLSTITALGLIAVPAAATDHSGTISSNETWLAAGNPHVIVGNVTVNAGVTLTMGAGVEVLFDSSRRITFNGTLTAVGTSGNEILFTR